MRDTAESNSNEEGSYLLGGGRGNLNTRFQNAEKPEVNVKYDCSKYT